MPLKSDYASQECSLARALEVIGERWTLLIVRDLFFGVRTFTDLQRHLDIPRAVLSARLDTLIASGVARRRAYRAGRYEYLLTDRGRGTWPVIFALHRWGEDNFAPHGSRRVFVHTPCGSTLSGNAACPRCHRTPDPADVTMLPGPGHDTTATDPVSVALCAPHRLLTPVPDRDR